MKQIPLSQEYISRIKKYYIQCIISEGSKIFIFAIVFNALSLFQEYVITLLILLILRTNGGGIHCKKYISCFLLSFSMILGNIVLAQYYPTSSSIRLIILMLCIPITVTLVPITSHSRPKLKKSVIKKSKLITFFFIIFFLLYTYLIPPNIIHTIGFWTIIMHTCQLILANILRRRSQNV